MNVFAMAAALVAVVWAGAAADTDCLKYLEGLHKLYEKDKLQFTKEISPYMLDSGKILDDMGFAHTCVASPNRTYSTVSITFVPGLTPYDFQLVLYYGLCFTDMCTPEQLTQQGAFLIQAMVAQNITGVEQVSFREVAHDGFSFGAFLMSMAFLAFFLLSLAKSFKKWFSKCTDNTAVSEEIELAEENGERKEVQVHSDLFDKLSYVSRMRQLVQEEDSVKIWEISVFRLAAIPLIVLGELFWLGNHGAYNYFSFDTQIYDTFYARLATFAYYLPDTFFLVSGFLFARSIYRIGEDAPDKPMQLIKAVSRKVLRLYPLYISAIVIYWLITPALHSGPLWPFYIDQTAQCNSTWWRAMLLIDNYFVDGCYGFAWYVQVDIQLTIVLSTILFLYFRNKAASMILLLANMLISFILFFIFSGELPVSVPTMLCNQTYRYFRSSYSHAFAYFTGSVLAYFLEKQAVRDFLQTYYVDNRSVFTLAQVTSFGLLILVLLRPGVWDQALQFQLALSRFGVLLGLTLMLLPGMIKNEVHKTTLHNFAHMSYPIILFSGLVTMSGFWALDTFAYVDGINLLNTLVAELLIIIPLGLFMGVLFDFRKIKVIN